jgi:hypothetical protein
VVSLFELKVILKNRWVWLFNPVEELLSYKYPNGLPDWILRVMRKIATPEEEARFAELQASNMITPEQFKKYNLWMEGEERCSSQSFVRAIEEGLVWKHLDEVDVTPELKVMRVGQNVVEYWD